MRRQVRSESRVQRFALVVIERKVVGAEIAGRVGGDAAREPADNVAALLGDLVRVSHVKMPRAPQLGRMKRHLPGANQRPIHGDGKIHIRFAEVGVVKEVVHAVLEGVHIQHPSPVRNLDAELVLLVAL